MHCKKDVSLGESGSDGLISARLTSSERLDQRFVASHRTPMRCRCAGPGESCGQDHGCRLRRPQN